MRNRLATKLGLIFLGFTCLVLISVGVMAWMLDAQKQDAVVINLAGRQRMLTQQIARLALEIERQDSEELRTLLQESQQTFDQTLRALRDGGPAPALDGRAVELPQTTAPAILAQIDQVERSWQGFQEQLQVVASAPSGSPELAQAVQVIESSSGELIAQADQLVQLFETQSTARLTTLRQAQLIFLASTLALLGVGVWVTYRYVLHPLQELGGAARRIGNGDLQSPVQAPGDVEIQVLSNTMEGMRAKLLASQQDVLNWANTLEERVLQRTQELEVVNSVSREISSRLDIKYVLNSVVEKSCQLFGADAAFLCLLTEDGKVLNLQSTSGVPSAVEACATNAEAVWARQVIGSEQAMHCDLEGCQGFCQIVAPAYRRSHLAAPLSIGNRVIGALCIASEKANYFTADSASYLTQLANMASIAIENARLYAQLEYSSTLEERHRIAAEMHDGLAQTLSFLMISTDYAKQQLDAGNLAGSQQVLERVQRGVEQAHADIRRAIASLQDEFPVHYTLQQQLGSLVEELKGDIPVLEWNIKSNLPLILAQADAEQVLRIAREALLNASKYSQATQIALELAQADGVAHVSVCDNGTGFDPGNLPADDRPHFGLKIMRARAARLNGKLEIQSQPGQGTQVVLSWPIQKDAQHG